MIYAHHRNITGQKCATAERLLATDAALAPIPGTDTLRCVAPEAIQGQDSVGLDADEFGALLRGYPDATIATRVEELGYDAALELVLRTAMAEATA